MTWSTPQNVPQPGHAALVPPGPLTLGDIAGGAWRVYKARFGLFLKLLLMPFLLMMGATAVFMVVAITSALSSPDAGRSIPPSIIGATILLYLVLLGLSLLLYVYQGRTVIAGIDLATGRENPTGHNLAERTRGMFGRVVMLLLLGLAFGVVLAVALVAVAVPIGMATSGRGNGAAGTGALFGVLAMLVFYAAIIWVSTKLTYIIPAMAEERLDAFPAIKRSWQLTDGAWWRTLGYQIVLGLISMAVFLVPYLIAVGVIAATAAAGGERGVGAGVAAGAMVSILIAVLVMWAAALLLVPYSYLFTGLMYLGRRRELEGAPAPQYPSQPYPPQQYPQNPWASPPAGGSTPQG